MNDPTTFLLSACRCSVQLSNSLKVKQDGCYVNIQTSLKPAIQLQCAQTISPEFSHIFSSSMEFPYTFGSVIPVHMMYKVVTSVTWLDQTCMTYPSSHHHPASNVPASNFLYPTISGLVVCLYGFVSFVLLYGDIACLQH